MIAFIKKHKLLAAYCALLAALILFAAILQLINYQKIIWGVRAAGQDFSGLTAQETRAKLNSLLADLNGQKIIISYKDSAWQIMPKELGIDFDADQTLKNMASVGHSRDILADSAIQLRSLFGLKTIPITLFYNDQKFQAFAAKNFQPLENPPRNATLKFDQNSDDFIFIPAQDGQIFDLSDIKQQINERLSLANQRRIVLKDIPAKAVLTQDENNIAKNQAKKILAQTPYFLNYNGQNWPVEKEDLIEWITFLPKKDDNAMEVSFSQQKISDFLVEIGPLINKEPTDARLSFLEGKVIEFSLSQNGTKLLTEESAKRISREILDGKNVVQLAISEKPPLISTKTIDTLGLTNLLGLGASNFAGSPKNRIHNIGVGAAKISGTLVKPGEEFYFNKTIGRIDKAQGYLPELVIKNNKTVPEYGGGICQVSTTIFRAAVNAGLKITERFAHAFPVKYYNPQGFDATIYPPNPDLKFLNDTPNTILVQSKIEGTQITFEIYGTKDDRETKVIGPTILESNPNGSMKTVLYQETWRNGALERKDTFRSNYKSPALYPVAKNPLE